MVDGDQGLLDERRHLGSELALSFQHLGLGHAGLEQWRYDLGPVPVGLRLGDAAKTLLVDPQPPLYDHRTKTTGKLELDSGYDRQFFLTDEVFWPRLWMAEGLPDDGKKLERDHALLA